MPTDNMLRIGTFHAMATAVIVSVVCDTTRNSELAIETTRSVFSTVEQQCSRFISNSDLSKINSSPNERHDVAEYCFKAVQEAYIAYQKTHGLFDPRILSDLINLGYNASWTKRKPPAMSSTMSPIREPLDRWQPNFLKPNSLIAGKNPLDLGGIGKGLALRWAGEKLKEDNFCNALIEAGGDCLCIGSGPSCDGWNIGIQNPWNPDGPPLSVLKLTDLAVCTSSTAVRNWWRNGAFTHHLISPSNGLPANNGLVAVTVVESDPATAEVWAKSLFLKGKDEIGEFCESNKMSAIWVCDNGETHLSANISPYVAWENSNL